MRPGTLALDIADAVRVCLGEQLERLSTSTCFLGMYPASTVVADWCGCGKLKGAAGGCGMGWTRMDRTFPSTVFPQLDTTARNCGAPLAAVVEVGVYRCLPVASGSGAPPTPQQLATATAQQAADTDAIYAALTCCEALTSRNVMLGTMTPRDAGGCGGPVWPVTVQLTR